MRVHELAKELKVASKELIQILKQNGFSAKNHMEVITPEGVALVKKKLKAPAVEAKTEAKPEKTEKTKTVLKPEIKKPEVKAKTEVPPPAPKSVFSVAEKKDTRVTPVLKPVLKEKPAVSAAPVKAAPAAQPPKVSPPSEAPKAVTAPVKPQEAVKAPEKVAGPLEIEMPITVGALAEKIRVRNSDLIKALIGMGIFANVNQLLNEEIIFKVTKHLNIPVKKKEDEDIENLKPVVAEDTAKLEFRPPVVTMMGHVDHGKTSLLDAIRNSNVASREAGQITQHIGAYGVDIPGKGHVTFLDTPGHEAFTAMRARGANVTDIVVLVVAADDGVKPQTVEAIDHARAAGCPIVVAMNKSDLPTANTERLMAQLQKLDLMPEEWGGKTICVKVSAKTGDGIPQLLELLLLQAEIMELKANPNRFAEGTIVEAKLSKGQGSVATVLVQKGTLKVSDFIVVGPYCGKIRAMRNDRGKNVKEAKPSYAVEILGLSGTPEAGEIFTAVADEKIARKISEKRLFEIREQAIKGFQKKHLSLEDLYSQVKEGRVKELKLIVKTDVQGSAEALTQSLAQTASDQIQVRVIHTGIGGINESDIMLAAASDAIVIGFHVKPDERAQMLAEKEGVDIRLYQIIYEALEDVRKAMEGLLEPTLKEVVEGRTEIRKVFQSSKIGTIGGSFVLKGKITRNHQVRLLRNNVIVFEGKLSSLKRFKDDVREVQEGYDCGVVLQGFDQIQEGDIVESYRVDKVVGKLT